MSKRKKLKLDISPDAVYGQPETSAEIINKYGTYEVQATSDTANAFPKIAQGLPKPENRKKDN